AAVALAAAAAGAALWLARGRSAAWALAIALAMAAAGALRFHAANPPLPSLDGFPAREAELEARVLRLFNSEDPARVSGIAVATAAPQHLSRYVGRALFLSGKRSLSAPAPVEGETFRARGVLSPLPPPEQRSSFERYLANQSALLSLRRGELIERTGSAPDWRYAQEGARRRL